MPVIDWTLIYQKYKGKWIALAKDEKTVLASGDDLVSVQEKAKEKTETPILFHVPSKILPYVGLSV